MTIEALIAQLNALRARWLSVADHFELARNDAVAQGRRVPGLSTAIMTFRKAAEELKEVMEGTWTGPHPDSADRPH